MSGACSTYGGLERCVQGIGERDHLEYPGVDGTIILKWILRKCDGMDWIDLAKDRDRWRSLVYAVMSLRVP